jgi:hypothetical protein
MPCVNWMRSLMCDVFSNRYGSELEKYIINKDPKTLADVEQYTLEYHRKLNQQVFN